MANAHTNPRQYTETHCKCIACGAWKLNEEFGSNKGTQNGLAYYCKACAANRARKNYAKRMSCPINKEKQSDKTRNYQLLKTHGVTAEEYEAMLAAQEYSCAICGVELSSRGHKTHLDHCHNTGKLRAMLCTNCNRGLGHFQDNEELLKKAADYLHQHNESACSHKEGNSR
jgi:hypothetical protein